MLADLDIAGQMENMIRSITYNDAINKAKTLNAKIIYDNDSYNLHYNYITEDDR